MILRSASLLLILTVLGLGCSESAETDLRSDELVARGATPAPIASGEDLYPDDPLTGALPAPLFALDGPSGAYVLEEHGGDIVVLHFWATWNELSQDGLMALDSLHTELGSDGLSFVGISEDDDGRPPLDTWALEHGSLSFPLVADVAGEVAEAYGEIDLLPTTVVIDRQGTIRARHTGILSSDELLDLLGPILIEDDEPLSDFDAPSQPGVVQSITADAVPHFVSGGAMLVDLRTQDRLKTDGTLPDAQHRPFDRLSAYDLPANFAVPVLFLSDSDEEALAAADLAVSWGYVAVYQIEGGVEAWREAGLPLQPLAESQPPPVVRARTVIG